MLIRDVKTQVNYNYSIKKKIGKYADLTERIIKIRRRIVGICKVNRILFGEEWLLGSRKCQPVLQGKRRKDDHDFFKHYG